MLPLRRITNATLFRLLPFGSWEEFANKKIDEPNPVYAEKVGNMIKVYLLWHNGEWGTDQLFYPGDQLNGALSYAKKKHKGAFRRSDVKFENLISSYDAYEKYGKDALPDEYTSKGGTIDLTPKAAPAKYKIQLGAFKTMRTDDYIADQYGLTDLEKENTDRLLSYDFTKADGKVLRRYYFGEYDSKADAIVKKKALEKKTNRKLLLVKN